MFRRLISVLALSLPLLATGLAPLAPAHAEDTLEPTGIIALGESWGVRYGEPESLNVLVLAEHGVPDGTVSVQVDGLSVDGILSPYPGGLPAGQAIVPLPLLEVGQYEIVLSYAGNERFTPSFYTTTLYVVQAESTLALTTTPERPWAGEAVTFTATVDVTSEGAAPTGTVTFRYDGEDLAIRPVALDGTASFTTSDLATGSNLLSAKYSGDAHYDGSEVPGFFYEVRRIATTTALNLTPVPATYGDSVRMVAVVRADVTTAGAPTGSVAFRIDGSAVEVPLTPVGDPSDGVSSAVLEKADLAVGAHTVGARFIGTASFAPSTAANPGPLAIARRTTALTASPVFIALNPFALPKAVLRATLSGNGRPIAGYPVTFTTGKTALCTATTNTDGVATCEATANAQRLALTLNGGYVAAYVGDANNTASSARGNLIG